MIALHEKVHFETEACQHLAAHGWLYADEDTAQFDCMNGLFPPDLLAWVEGTQPESFQSLTQQAANNSKEQFASSPDLTRR